MNIYPIFKKIAFQTDPEKVHEYSIEMFNHFPQLAYAFPHAKKNEKLQLSDGHMQWNFPIGLAAGFDKNAQAISFFDACGFGAVEVGTVTKIPQVGNPRPRIWRYPEISSVRNAMGFPNQGSLAIKKNILNTKHNTCLGVNIGKNKDTSLVDTPSEYAYLYDYFADCAQYLVINISSPNTPGLRNLQTKEAFREICLAIEEKRIVKPKPLYLKIAPDLNQEDIYDLVDLAKEFKLSGVIATNTTIQHNYGAGGLSGKFIKDISKQTRRLVCEAAKETPELSVIGVGGIDSLEEVIEFWKQGGSFVQIYTSFIFHGPQILKDMQKGLQQLLKKSQAQNLQEFYNDLKKWN